MILLSIESSCDETAVAVTDGRRVLANIVSTQVAEHRLYGGVVPEIASRRHCEAISACYLKALKTAGITERQIEAVAVTFAPGLIGALLVGVNFAKGLALSLGVPLIPVHHLRSHIAANYLADETLTPPFLCLVVSGGNTLLCEVRDYTEFLILGQTGDDAAGECFDKTARAMGLAYPGGVTMDKIATTADPVRYPLPTPKPSTGSFDFSFSGLKTAVINLIHHAEQIGEPLDVPVLCATVRQKVCDILLENTMAALQKTGQTKLALAGGVSANSELRRRMEEACMKRGISLFVPPLCYCGDNAAMVGAQAYYEYKAGHVADASLNAYATMPIDFNKKDGGTP